MVVSSRSSCSLRRCARSWSVTSSVTTEVVARPPASAPGSTRVSSQRCAQLGVAHGVTHFGAFALAQRALQAFVFGQR